MRIQEMKSGISHLKKKMGSDGGENYLSLAAARAALARDEELVVASQDCDLNDARWSLVSFDRREAGGLTYAQAVHLMSELDALDVPGLCIVTDEAAGKLTTKNGIVA